MIENETHRPGYYWDTNFHIDDDAHARVVIEQFEQAARDHKDCAEDRHKAYGKLFEELHSWHRKGAVVKCVFNDTPSPGQWIATDSEGFSIAVDPEEFATRFEFVGEDYQGERVGLYAGTH